MRLSLPHHKYILSKGSGTKPLYILVDAFNYGPKLPESFFEKNHVLFFLTHAHSDHYTGLRANWECHGHTVHCSETTGRLIEHLLDLPASKISPLPMNTPVDLPYGVKVTLVDANHCPGAVMFLFILPDGTRVVHCGDFRYDASKMSGCKHLEEFKGCSAVYLDTTYCNPRHMFPHQSESIEKIAEALENVFGVAEQASTPRKKRKVDVVSRKHTYDTMCLISTYVIGKERILEQIHRRFGLKIYIEERKAGVVENLGVDMTMFTTDAKETPIHVVKWNFLGESWPYFRPNFVDPAAYAERFGVSKVIGFVPTGWVFSKDGLMKTLHKNNVTIHLVPYSEHSSYAELMEFVAMLRPAKVVPTVNASDEKMVAKQLKHFSNLIDVNASKSSFISKLSKSGQAPLPSENVKKENPPAEEEDDIVILQETDGPKIRSQGVDSDIVNLCFEDNDATTTQLMDICSGISRLFAEKLLRRHCGNVEKAASDYFDHLDQPKRKPGTTPKKTKGHQSTLLSFYAKSPGKTVTKLVICENPESPIKEQKTPEAIQSSSMQQLQLNIREDVQADAVSKSLEVYDATKDAPWASSDPTPYLHIARTFETMESTTKRLKISDALTNALRSVLDIAPQDILKASYLFLGRLAPDYHGVELNIGGSTVATAMTEALGISRTKIHEMHKSMGDLGDIAHACKRAQTFLRPPEPLTVDSVYDTMMKIATDQGAGTGQRKKALIVKLLRSSVGPETKYLVRTLVRNLRIGASWRSVVPAIGKAILIHKMQKVPTKDVLDQAATTSINMYHMNPDISKLIDVMLQHELEDWACNIGLTPGVPIKPMLARISDGVADAFNQIDENNVLVEYKYDGMRAQIHINKQGFDTTSMDSMVKIFSRNSEDRTQSFSDVIENVVKSLRDDISEAIFDSEIVAVSFNDKNEMEILSFQELSKRPRLGGASSSMATSSRPAAEVCVFMFDVLQINGQSLLRTPLSERRRLLEEALPNRALHHRVTLAEGTIMTDNASDSSLKQEKQDIIQKLLVDALGNKAEGLMLKVLESPYDPNKRSNKWIKLKKDYCDDLSDTFDCVVVGAWHGNGRKAGWFSPFLLAVFDSATQTFQSLCRVMSGFSDEFYKQATERLSKTILPSKPYDVVTNEQCSVWFTPKEVWEIRGAELQISPVHCAAAGMAHEDKGLGLRFPRFVRTRDDKTLDEDGLTTSDDVVSRYLKQNK